MKLDKVMKDLCKSMKCFEHPTVRLVLIVILVIYCSGLIKQVNRAVSSVIKDDIVKLIVIIVITLVAMKDPVLAILLTLALVLSLNTNEYFGHEAEGENNDNDDSTNDDSVNDDSANDDSVNDDSTNDNNVVPQGSSLPVGVTDNSPDGDSDHAPF